MWNAGFELLGKRCSKGPYDAVANGSILLAEEAAAVAVAAVYSSICMATRFVSAR